MKQKDNRQHDIEIDKTVYSLMKYCGLVTLKNTSPVMFCVWCF